ncbi:MAG: L,D-transpeptidase family protein [Rhizobiaceae bacterium]|nr:L,D-transpeptidase family protein [Rhizobiaceae bacterium]
MQNYYGSTLNFLNVTTRPGYRDQGLLSAGGHTLRCALGRSGIGIKRGEGDGITPRGQFRLLSAMVRSERVSLRNAGINLHSIDAGDGWCDAPGDRNYNRPVGLPYPASCEKLARDDHLYDIAIVLDINISRRMTVGGSAIFFHLARDDYRATEGCVAISRRDMLWLLPRIGTQTKMLIT